MLTFGISFKRKMTHHENTIDLSRLVAAFQFAIAK